MVFLTHLRLRGTVGERKPDEREIVERSKKGRAVFIALGTVGFLRRDVGEVLEKFAIAGQTIQSS